MEIDYNTEIQRYTTDIWEQILGLEVTPTQDSFNPAEKGITLVGCVQIMGSWEGSVELLCPAELAKKAASIMFGTNMNETSQEDIKDALGELTNMTGGNIKSIVHDEDQQCYLSLPAVAVSDNQMHVPGTREIAKATFKHENHLFVVRMMKKIDKKK
jgi:chemotaxis protein CheX